MATSLQLSWIDSLKQWRKRRMVNGKTKTFYLGTGNGKTDKPSYDAALAKWQTIEKSIVANEQTESEVLPMRWARFALFLR